MRLADVVGKRGAVQLDCDSEVNDLGDEFGPIYSNCKWQVEPDVIQAVIDCSLNHEKIVLSRNMDDTKNRNPWRITRFDRDSGDPVGHSYGKTPSDALKPLEPWDMCELVSSKRRSSVSALSALPRRGRIPLATAKSALKRLGRKAKTCGITPTALREGMEVEREHRDVTRGGVLKTAKIAAAHLCEDGRYYRALKTMERKLKRGK